MLKVYFLASTSGVIWGILSVVVFILVLLLTIIILVQDSKDSGLTSAFGGGGGSALMGARMQKDLAKITAVMGVILAICLISMGLITAHSTRDSKGSLGASGTPTVGAGTETLPANPDPLAGTLKFDPKTAQRSTNTSSTPSPPSGTLQLPVPITSPPNAEEKLPGEPSPSQKE